MSGAMASINGDIAVVRAYVEEGLSVGQCAIRFDLSRALVRRILDRHDIARDPARRKPRIDIDEQSLVTAYRDQGLTVAACARKFGISQRSAVRVLDRHRVPRRPPADLTVSGQAIARAYQDAGRPVQACAQEFGIPPSAVERILDRHGVPRRPHRARFAGIDVPAVLAAVTRDGVTLAEAATTFGISPQTVERIRDSHPLPPARTDLITPREAARILGLPSRDLKYKDDIWQLTIRRTPGGHRRYLRGEIEDLARRLADQRDF
jgi:transposase-like protein